MPIGEEYFFERGHRCVRTKCYDIFADPVYLEMLKVSDAVAKEEAKQRRAAEKAARERKEKIEEEIVSLLDIFDEQD